MINEQNILELRHNKCWRSFFIVFLLKNFQIRYRVVKYIYKEPV